MKLGETKSIYAKDLGMDAASFHDFAGSLMGGAIRAYVGVMKHHEDSTGSHYIDMVVIMRTE